LAFTGELLESTDVDAKKYKMHSKFELIAFFNWHILRLLHIKPEISTRSAADDDFLLSHKVIFSILTFNTFSLNEDNTYEF
jgi:hypothetical protein